MNVDRLKPVERFDELRAGMSVVFFGCATCGTPIHEMLLGSLGVDKLGRRAYHVLDGARPECGMIGDYTVRTGYLFRVDDGLDPAADARQAAQDERDAAAKAKATPQAKKKLAVERRGVA